MHERDAVIHKKPCLLLIFRNIIYACRKRKLKVIIVIISYPGISFFLLVHMAGFLLWVNIKYISFGNDMAFDQFSFFFLPAVLNV